MNILIKSATVIDPSSPHHGKVVDLLVENGVISSIRAKINADKNIKVIDLPNMHISAGWMDMQVSFCDPGFEHKEDLESGIRAAAAGGFTAVATVSGTNPPIHSKAEVQYIINKTNNAIVNVHPLGALSHNREGKDISEMYDMKQAGAVAFSDDKRPVSDAGLLMRALLYSKNFNGLIITHCDERSISLDGKMNEGEVSTTLGLKGIPALAEELMISRNISLAEYTGAPIHIANISTQGSVELIRQAKARGTRVTASVNAYNLALDDSALVGFDSNFKLDPPLRGRTDIDALKKGITDGTIDVITSDHRPQDIESKDVEFDHASHGMIGLETMFALLNTNRGKTRLDHIIRALTSGPRQVLQLEPVTIAEGELANITLFDPDAEWTFEKKNIRSRSFNSPFIGSRFKGKALGIVNGKQVQINKN
jgi:dihydroorotase